MDHCSLNEPFGHLFTLHEQQSFETKGLKTRLSMSTFSRIRTSLLMNIFATTEE